MAETFKVYELDFGDTNLLSENIQDILYWISIDMKDMRGVDELQYNITVKMMTREEINAIPEWA